MYGPVVSETLAAVGDEVTVEALFRTPTAAALTPAATVELFRTDTAAAFGDAVSSGRTTDIAPEMTASAYAGLRTAICPWPNIEGLATLVARIV